MAEYSTGEKRHARRRPEQVDRAPARGTQNPRQTDPYGNAVHSGYENRKKANGNSGTAGYRQPATANQTVRSRSGISHATQPARKPTYGRPARDPAAIQRTQQPKPRSDRNAQGGEIPRQAPSGSPSSFGRRTSPDKQTAADRGNPAYRQPRSRMQTQRGNTRAVAPVTETPIQALVRSWKQSRAVSQEKRARKAAEAEARWQKDIVRVHGGVDKIMLGIILLLVAFGTVMVFSASYPYALTKGYDVLYYGKRQLFFALAGLAFMAVLSFVPYRFYCNKVIVFGAYGIGVLLLLAVLVLGVSEGEARRWIQLGPITIQPSEMMKFILVLALAYYMQTNQKTLHNLNTARQKLFYNVIFPGVIIGIACGLVLLEKHLSATLIIGCIGLLVMLVGGCDWKWVVPCFTAAGGLLAGIFVVLNPYALKRLTTFGDEDADLLAEKFQTNQSLYAIGSGGLFGVGLGESRQKYSYIYAAHNDFIFAIVCEEFGFIGAVCLIGLFLAFIWRGYVIASRAPDMFSMLVAFGITTQVGIQAMLNMCVVADIIPNTGISLPFFSYGGSSLLVLLCEMGVLLSISRQYYMTRDQLREEEARKELGMD